MESGRSSNPAEPFLRHSRRQPEHLALWIAGTRWTYGALAAEAGRVARWLGQRLGPGPARVGILAARSLEAYRGILGAQLAGHAYVPLSPTWPAERLAWIFQKAKLDALLVDDAGHAALTPGLRLAVPHLLGPGGAELASLEPVTEPAPGTSETLAYLIFTSGTTGNPKGVQISWGNLDAYARALASRYAFTPDDRFSQVGDLTWDLSVFDLVAAWRAGGSLHVLPEAERLAPDRFIREQALTVWCSAPTVVKFLADLHKLAPGAFPTVHTSMFCGEALLHGSAQAWIAATPGGVTDNHYGPTEATVSCTVHRCRAGEGAGGGTGVVAIGEAFPGMRAAVVDPEDRFEPAGSPGELVLAGPQLALGYADEPELTAARFRTLVHPRWGEQRWYFTGDRAVEDRDGCLHHLGRLDNQIKILGHRIELEEVEAHLRRHAETGSVVAVGWPLRQGLPVRITALVAGSPLPVEEILARLRAHVPAYLVPGRLLRVDAVPLNSNGKVDRRAALAQLEARS